MKAAFKGRFTLLAASIFLMLTGIIFDSARVNAESTVFGTMSVVYDQVEARHLLDLINAYRSENGLPELYYSYDLEKAAMQRAAEETLMNSGKIGMRPNGKGESSILSEYNIKNQESCYSGEAVSKGASYLSEEVNYMIPLFLRADITCVGVGHAVIPDEFESNDKLQTYPSWYYGGKYAGRTFYEGWHYWVIEVGSAVAGTETEALRGRKDVRIEINPDLFETTLLLNEESLMIEKGIQQNLPEVIMRISTAADHYHSTDTELSIDTEWTVSDPEIVTLDHDNLFGNKVGRTTLAASVAGQTLSIDVKVASKIFDDVNDEQWWYNAVQYVHENNIMAGAGDSFRPTDPVTREQFVQVLYNHKGKTAVTMENKFPDVDVSQWYKSSVLWANENGIASGNGDGSFGVGQNITREALALMLYKYAKMNGFDMTAKESAIEGFADTANVSSWAQDALNWAVTQGIMSGKGEKGASKSMTRLDPQGNATRAECASMMKKLLTMGE